jgi:phage-related protein
MNVFPTLKTGAALQYPAQRSLDFSTVALQFVDGSEQRFRNYEAPLRQWEVRLQLLDQAELHQIQEFVRTMSGQAEDFCFTDPWDGTVYSSCRLGGDALTGVLAGEWSGTTVLTVLENRG